MRELGFLQNHYQIPQNELMELHDHQEGIVEMEADWSHLPFRMIIKGQQDVILTKSKTFVVGLEGGYKRCGGIGDILAGVASTTGLWDLEYGLPLASCILRMATRKAFDREGRGLTAPSIIEHLSCSVK